MKRTLISLFLVLTLLIVPLASCHRQGNPPPLEDVYDDIVALLERCYDINNAVFGEGLPVHAIGSEYAEQHGLYKDTDYATYQYVRDDAPYRTTAEVRDALLEVYSSDYVASLSGVLFDGFVMGSRIEVAQLYEQNGYLMQRTDYEPLFSGRRVYDYSSMRIVKPSTATRLTVEIDSRGEGEDTYVKDKLSLVFENGVWRLDAPAF